MITLTHCWPTLIQTKTHTWETRCWQQFLSSVDWISSQHIIPQFQMFSLLYAHQLRGLVYHKAGYFSQLKYTKDNRSHSLLGTDRNVICIFIIIIKIPCENIWPQDNHKKCCKDCNQENINTATDQRAKHTKDSWLTYPSGCNLMRNLLRLKDSLRILAHEKVLIFV